MEDDLNVKELSGYLKNLIEEYGLISKMQPIYEKSSNKNVHYTINDQFLKFGSDLYINIHTSLRPAVMRG